MSRPIFDIFPPRWGALQGSWQPFHFTLADGAGATIEITVAVPINASREAMLRMGYDAVQRALSGAARDIRAHRLGEGERLMLRTGLPPSAK